MFLVIWAGIQLTPKGQGVSAIYMIIAFLIMAISELSLSAIGLSLITKLAPPNYLSLYMGIWLVTLGIGGKLAGVIAQWAPVSGDIHSIQAGMSSGLELFIVLTIVGAVLCLLLRRFVIAKS